MPARLRQAAPGRAAQKAVRHSFPSRLLPLPAPARCGHAKPSVPSIFRASERRTALAGFASPRPADGSPVHRQAVTRLPPRRKAVMTAAEVLLKCADG